jgi:hypothetical protein
MAESEIAVHHGWVGRQDPPSVAGRSASTDGRRGAKLRIALRVVMDENLRCVHWDVETRQGDHTRLGALIRPVCDIPFQQGVREALDAAIDQHRRHGPGPFDD